MYKLFERIVNDRLLLFYKQNKQIVKNKNSQWYLYKDSHKYGKTKNIRKSFKECQSKKDMNLFLEIQRIQVRSCWTIDMHKRCATIAKKGIEESLFTNDFTIYIWTNTTSYSYVSY